MLRGAVAFPVEQEVLGAFSEALSDDLGVECVGEYISDGTSSPSLHSSRQSSNE
jgi:hypothetical protein